MERRPGDANRLVFLELCSKNSRLNSSTHLSSTVGLSLVRPIIASIFSRSVPHISSNRVALFCFETRNNRVAFPVYRADLSALGFGKV